MKVKHGDVPCRVELGTAARVAAELRTTAPRVFLASDDMGGNRTMIYTYSTARGVSLALLVLPASCWLEK